MYFNCFCSQQRSSYHRTEETLCKCLELRSMRIKEQRVSLHDMNVLLPLNMRCRPCECRFALWRCALQPRTCSGTMSALCSMGRMWQVFRSMLSERLPPVIVLPPSPSWCWFFEGLTKALISYLAARLHSIWSSHERKGICKSFRDKIRIEGKNRDPRPLQC